MVFQTPSRELSSGLELVQTTESAGSFIEILKLLIKKTPYYNRDKKVK
jgi:hypothetical protein